MKKLMNILFCIFFSALIIMGSIRLTIGFKSLYYFDIDYLNIDTENDMTKEEVKLNYDYMIDYNLDKISGEFNLPTLKSSPEGKIHFEEVKEIFQNINKLLLLSLIITVIGVVLNLRNKSIYFLNLTSKLVIILPILVSIPMIINFNQIFIIFHKILFDNDYWIFDPIKDPVINILPEEFFYHAGTMIIILVILSSIVLRYIYQYYKSKN